MSQIAAPCDRGLAARSSASAPALRPRLALAGCVLASSLAFIDGSAVNLALPVIQGRLGGGLASAQWVMNAYSLMLGALVLAGGALADRYGRRRILLWGVALFSLGSFACGLALGIGPLIGARAVQGVGAAMLTPASLALLGASFDDKARGRAIGLWAGASGLMSALGPVLGGWLADAVSWRAVFFINLPLAALAAWLVLAGARESRAQQAGGLDWAGAALVTTGLGLVTWSLTEAPARGLGDAPVIAALSLGALALAAFLLVERRAASPLLRLGLFRSSTFMGANVLTLLLYAAFGGALFLLPFELIRAHGYAPAAAGAALLPLSVGLAALSPFAGRLVAQLGARTLLAAGSLIVAAGFALLGWRAGAAGYWTGPFPGLVAMALGMGLAVAPLTDAVMGAVDPAYEGAAAGVNTAVARVAGLLAVALVGFVVSSPDAAAVAHGYRIAMFAAAACAVAAAGVGFVMVRAPPQAS